MKHIKLKIITTLVAVLSALPMWAATGDVPADKNWFAQDGTFWMLVLIALLMMYVIYALAEVVIWGAKKKMDENKKISSNKPMLLLIGFSLWSSLLNAQDTAAPIADQTAKESFLSSPYLPLYILLFIEACVITYLSLMLYQLTKRQTVAESVIRKSWFARKWEKWNYKVPVERENEILLDDHDYDGIHELDNSLPPWLNYIFVVSFVFAVIYFVYHFFNISPTQDELYAESVVKAEQQLAEYREKAADYYDENSVVLDNSAGVLTSGKTIFAQYCVACHGAAGEGSVGPNLTDAYWIHGGTINDLFKTVKYGVQEKGMASWKDIISPKQIFEVTNYIKSLNGTNPPNGKEAQGTLFQDGAGTADTTVAPVDSVITSGSLQ